MNGAVPGAGARPVSEPLGNHIAPQPRMQYCLSPIDAVYLVTAFVVLKNKRNIVYEKKPVLF